MIFILDSDEKVAGILTNNGSPNSCPYYDDVLKESIEVGASTYEFYVPSNHDVVDTIEEGGYVVRADLDGHLRMFSIMQIEESHGNENKKYVYAEDAGLELLNDIVRPGTYENKNQDEILDIVLLGSRWKRGETEYLGFDTFTFENYDNVLATLQSIAKQLNGELSFRVEMKNGEVSGRYVDLVKQRGTVTKKRFTYSKDIVSIKRKVDMSNVVTALVGVGSNDTNFKSIEYTKSANGFEKPLNQDWVGDPDALQRWGKKGKHIFGKFEYDTTDPKTLLDKTWEQLQILKEPSITYEMDVALLERLAGIEHEKVRIGDTVYVIDETFSPALYLEARVLELETCFSDPSNDKCTLGNYKIAKSNITAQMRALQSKLLKKEATWDQVGEALQVANNAQETANTANETASTAQEVANTAQQTAESAQESATNAENTANNALETANQAQETANNAQTTANNAMTAANGKNTVYRQLTQPTGAFAVGDLWFDTANGNRVNVWDGSQWVPSQFGDMAIANIDAGSITTGTLDADKVTVKNLTAGSIKSLDGLNINDQFIVDENGNVTFKGNLAGATGTFSGIISTSADANVGKNVNLGGLTDYAQKKITFNDQAFISSDGTQLSLRGPNTVTITNNNGAYIEMDGNTVSIGGVLSADSYIYVNPEKLLTSSVETGNCGVAGINSIGTSGVFAGVWVPFRVRKTYTPASVTLTTGSHNLSSLAGVQTTNATINGFWLYLTGQTIEQIYRYWRGTYSA